VISVNGIAVFRFEIESTTWGHSLSKVLQLLMLISLLGYLTQLSANTLTVCVEDNISNPFYDTTGGILRGGILTKLVSEVASKNQFRAEFVVLSWPRCMDKVPSGEINAILGIIYTPERASVMAFPAGAEQQDPKIYLWQARYPFFVKKGQALNLAEIEKTPKFGIGTLNEYVTHQILEQKNLLPPYDYDVETGLKLVAAGRLDAYVIDTQTGMDIIKKLHLSNMVEPTTEALLESYWHIAFNQNYYKEHKPQVDKFWSDLAEIRFKILSKMNKAE
jgi:polar amino acid transport system substrate-binding protein